MNKVVEVEIVGACPMLHHRYCTEENGTNKKSAKKKVYEPTLIAEKSLYKNADGTLYSPSEHILGALIKAGTKFTFEKRTTYKELMKGSVVVTPDAIPLLNSKSDNPLKTWDEIDARPVVIQRARVISWRPKFNDWRLKFQIEILEPDLVSVTALKEILEAAGRIGIGDYRPRFGRFMITSFKEV